MCARTKVINTDDRDFSILNSFTCIRNIKLINQFQYLTGTSFFSIPEVLELSKILQSRINISINHLC